MYYFLKMVKCKVRSRFSLFLCLYFSEIKMNKFSVAVSALVLGSAMLAGCQNTSKLEADVQALSNKVDNLAAQVDALKSDVQAAQASADNANSRLDNMVVHYRK